MDVCVNFWIEQRIESCHKIQCSLLHLNLETVGRKSCTLLILAPAEKTWQPVMGVVPAPGAFRDRLQLHDPKWDYPCGENGRRDVGSNVLSLHFTIIWPTDRVNNRAGSIETTFSHSVVYERPLPAGSCYETYYLRAPRGSREPIVGNRK